VLQRTACCARRAGNSARMRSAQVGFEVRAPWYAQSTSFESSLRRALFPRAATPDPAAKQQRPHGMDLRGFWTPLTCPPTTFSYGAAKRNPPSHKQCALVSLVGVIGMCEDVRRKHDILLCTNSFETTPCGRWSLPELAHASVSRQSTRRDVDPCLS
jgi:hypothetical protein